MAQIVMHPAIDEPPDDGVPPLGDEYEPRANGHAHNATPAQPLFDPERARGRIALLDEQPETVEIIVQDLLRRTCGVRNASGGTGKSTLALFEMICIIQGCPLYGREVRRQGPCILLTAEDERQVVEYRLCRILEDMQLPRAEREHILSHLYIEDTTGRTVRLVDVTMGGALMQTTAVAQFIEQYRDIKPAFVSIDPMSLFGPGERHVNDGEAELLRAGRAISYGLKAAVRFEHHVGKQNSRDRQTDQYAGRGGSAGADNARFVQILQAHTAEDKTLIPPQRIAPEDILRGNVMRLHIAKDSYGQRLTSPIWIRRNGFLFEQVPPDPAIDVDPMEGQLRRLYEFIETETENGITHTANTLDNRVKEIGQSRQMMRATLHVALERGHLIEQALPKEQQHGRRKSYLARGLRP